eukprot:m.326202 g.326202  ORF g.326202 m.326202 type:complete len:801 (-) comp16556_c0_seq15:54-2456(-)
MNSFPNMENTMATSDIDDRRFSNESAGGSADLVEKMKQLAYERAIVEERQRELEQAYENAAEKTNTQEQIIQRLERELREKTRLAEARMEEAAAAETLNDDLESARRELARTKEHLKNREKELQEVESLMSLGNDTENHEQKPQVVKVIEEKVIEVPVDNSESNANKIDKTVFEQQQRELARLRDLLDEEAEQRRHLESKLTGLPERSILEPASEAMPSLADELAALDPGNVVQDLKETATEDDDDLPDLDTETLLEKQRLEAEQKMKELEALREKALREANERVEAERLAREEAERKAAEAAARAFEESERRKILEAQAVALADKEKERNFLAESEEARRKALLAELCRMFPDVEEDFIENLLAMHNYDRDATVAVLLANQQMLSNHEREKQDAQFAQTMSEDERARLEAERKLKRYQETRDAIVARGVFHTEASSMIEQRRQNEQQALEDARLAQAMSAPEANVPETLSPSISLKEKQKALLKAKREREKMEQERRRQDRAERDARDAEEAERNRRLAAENRALAAVSSPQDLNASDTSFIANNHNVILPSEEFGIPAKVFDAVTLEELGLGSMSGVVVTLKADKKRITVLSDSAENVIRVIPLEYINNVETQASSIVFNIQDVPVLKFTNEKGSKKMLNFIRTQQEKIKSAISPRGEDMLGGKTRQAKILQTDGLVLGHLRTNDEFVHLLSSETQCSLESIRSMDDGHFREVLCAMAGDGLAYKKFKDIKKGPKNVLGFRRKSLSASRTSASGSPSSKKKQKEPIKSVAEEEEEYDDINDIRSGPDFLHEGRKNAWA